MLRHRPATPRGGKRRPAGVLARGHPMVRKRRGAEPPKACYGSICRGQTLILAVGLAARACASPNLYPGQARKRRWHLTRASEIACRGVLHPPRARRQSQIAAPRHPPSWHRVRHALHATDQDGPQMPVKSPQFRQVDGRFLVAGTVAPMLPFVHASTDPNHTCNETMRTHAFERRENRTHFGVAP
jgi:hypothetical protein